MTVNINHGIGGRVNIIDQSTYDVIFSTPESGIITGVNQYNNLSELLITNGDCCYYPYTIETYYEKYIPDSDDEIAGVDIIIQEDFGRDWLSSIRLCTKRGEYFDWDIENNKDCACHVNPDFEFVCYEGGFDEPEDFVEPPASITDNVTETCKRYYLKSSSCEQDETEDVLGNCINLSYQTPAVVDRLGNVCYEGNIDLCGICFGKSDGTDLDGLPLEYDVLNNPITCNPSECPAGVGSLSIFLDEYQILNYGYDDMV